MDEYKSNSNRSREKMNKPEVKKVVTGNVSQRQKTGLQKAAGAFIANDVRDVQNHILYDVIIPGAKRLFLDALSMLLGESTPRRSSVPAGKVSYRSYYNKQEEQRSRRDNIRSIFDYNDLEFDDRGDAEEVLYRMEEMISHFDVVSISDMYDMAGETCPYTGSKYGWTDLHDAYVERVRGKYVIRLPKATQL